MDKGPEYTFFQRSHTSGQQVHENVFSVTKSPGKLTSKPQRGITSYLLGCLLQKGQEMKSDGREKGTSGHCYILFNVNCYSHCGNQYGRSLRN